MQSKELLGKCSLFGKWPGIFGKLCWDRNTKIRLFLSFVSKYNQKREKKKLWNHKSLFNERHLIKSNFIKIFTKNVIKACVCYFLSNSYFFTKWWHFKNYENVFLFHLKSSFHSRDIQIFVIFSLSTLSKFKRTNGSGTVYDVMNWLA